MKSIKMTKNFILKKNHIRHLRRWSLTMFGATLFVISLFALHALAQTSPRENSALVTLTNEERTSRGLPTLEVNQKLEEAAYAKARDMFTYEYFDHFSPQERTPWDFISGADYQYYYAGENLAIDFEELQSTHKAWMLSPTHRANILDPDFAEIGIATVTGEFEGRKTTITVQMFGSTRWDSAIHQVKEIWQ